MPGPPAGSPKAGAGTRGWRWELGIFALAYATYFGVRAVTEGSVGAMTLPPSFGRIRAVRRLACRPMSMGEFAAAMGIDPPNATRA